MAKRPFCSTQEIASETNATLAGDGNIIIDHLLTDSRRLVFPQSTLFFAIKTSSNDGHRYISELYKKGVRAFVVNTDFDCNPYNEAAFLLSDDVVGTLQKLASVHRNQFSYPLVGITGSNGKTVVKEWLFQLLNSSKRVVRSPRSFNSQIGVPLSLWQMGQNHEVAIIEAGVSVQDEMLRLRDMINPSIGIFTNLGHAHSDGFPSLEAKAYDKAELFKNAEKVIFCADQELVSKVLNETLNGDEDRLLGWTLKGKEGAILVRKEGSFLFFQLDEKELKIHCPFADSGSIENLIHSVITAWHLGIPANELKENASHLRPVEMRLEERKAIRGNLLINDFYNSDPESVRISLELLMQQPKSREKIVVLSEFEGIPQSEKEAEYQAVVKLLNGISVNSVIGIGSELADSFKKLNHPHSIYKNTAEFLAELPSLKWQNAAILLKGARKFEFEKIANSLQEQVHQTWLEVNLSAMAHNLRTYKQQLNSDTKLMAMVKALSYGSGSTEIARLLQHNHVDYLAVAYVDEGITLRQGGIELPIMVINSDPSAYKRMLEFDLEPEIFSLKSLNDYLAVVDAEYNGSDKVKIHLKLETGMHRLGLEQKDLNELIETIKNHRNVEVASIFSHLAASDDQAFDDFTKNQISRFENMANGIITELNYRPILHIANTSAIARFPQAQYNMVRLGIGLYGAANSAQEQKKLEVVTRWMTRISQIKKVMPGESVGYGRSFIATHETRIATLPVGYADGFFRSMSNGKGHVFLGGKKVPVVGKVCMDMIMVDVSALQVREGDVVEIMGENISATEIAKASGTVAYEVLTHISPRVPRVYITE